MPDDLSTDAVNVNDTAAPQKASRFWLTAFLVLGGGAILVCLLLPVTRSVRPMARRNTCANNLRQIALALQNYENTFHALPPAYTVDADGKPLHSWRTLILPFLEQRQLYNKIDLSKAWDDPANAEAYNSEVSPYRCPSADCPENHTTYLANVAPNGCFHLTEPRPSADIDGHRSKTLMVMEVPEDQAVHWMSPVDADESLVMALGPKSKLPHAGGMNAAFDDAHVEFLEADMPAADRRALISVAGDDAPTRKTAD